jgi:DNA-binding LacI/PurR family transcriptional regulator
VTTRQKNRPKLADVARLAGTSEAAVSVVLNGRVGESARVSEDTQARIWDAVRQLGYTANPVARSLAGGRNRIIGVFTFEPTFPMGEHDFYYPFLIGVEAEAAAQGYDLLLFASAGAALDGQRTIYRNGVNRLRLADGAILLGRQPDRAELGRLAADNFPFAYIGRRDTPDGTPISYSAADYADATAQIVRYMRQHGHRKFIYLRVPDSVESSLDRETGYLSAAPDGDVWYGQPDELSPQMLQEMFRTGVTAILTEGDAFGLAVLNLAQQLGVRCPEHFSLAVLGDPMLPVPNLPDWTRFRIPREAMGREAVRILLTMLDDPETPTPIQVMLPCTFEAGSTVAAPPFSLDFV